MKTRIGRFYGSVKNKAAVAGVLMLSAYSAFAQTAPADPFTDSMTAATDKVNTYGAALVGLAAAGVVFGIGIKYVKKIRGAA